MNAQMNIESVDSSYRAAIEYLAKNKKNKDFYNHGGEHAKIVFANIFENAKHEVRIFAEDLKSDVPNSGEYKQALSKFFENGGTAKIMIENNPDLNKPIYELLRTNKDKVSIKKTSIRPKYENVFVNFSTADDHIYRLEVDKEEKLARGNFNDTKFTTMLNERFDAMFADERSQSIPI